MVASVITKLEELNCCRWRIKRWGVFFKVWVLETLIGQDVNKSAIAPGINRLWNTGYINGEWNAYVQRSAMDCALQAEAKDWLKGVGYSMSLDSQAIKQAIADRGYVSSVWKVLISTGLASTAKRQTAPSTRCTRQMNRLGG